MANANFEVVYDNCTVTESVAQRDRDYLIKQFTNHLDHFLYDKEDVKQFEFIVKK